MLSTAFRVLKKATPFLLLVAAVLGVYAPALRNGFVWDDTALILRDPLIRSPRLIPEGFQHFLFTDATASNFYRPIQRLTYTLEYAAFGWRAAAYHLTSLFCHAAAAMALFGFARELLRRFRSPNLRSDVIAFISAFIWAIHPLHSSAVVYVSGRADPLAAMFGFAALHLGLVSFRATGSRAWLLTGGATICLLCSALSKESGLIFAALWLLLAVPTKAISVRSLAPITLVLAAYFSLRLGAEQIAPPPPQAMPALVRPILAARAVAEYAGLIILPRTLRMERDVESHPFGFSAESITGASWRELQTIAGLLLIAAFIFWIVRVRKTDRGLFVALLCTLIAYLPVSGITRLNATVAEHWLYLPCAFLFLAAAVSLAKVRAQRFLVPALAAWVLFLGGRTFARTFDWKDQQTFLERTIACGGDSGRMFINLARLEMEEGRLDAAKQHLTIALAKDPEQPFAIINRAALAVKEDDSATAREMLGRAVEIPLIAARAHEMLAVLEFKESGTSNLSRMRLASRTGAADWEIEKRYVKLLLETGADEAARSELRHCLQTQWYRAESWQLLGVLAARSGRRDEALAALERANAYDVHLHKRVTPL